MKKRRYIPLVLLAFAFLTVTQILAEENAILTKYDSALLRDGARQITMCLPAEDCSVDCHEQEFPPDEGCRMYAEDENTARDDGCYTSILPLGFNIDDQRQNTNDRLEELSEQYRQVSFSVGIEFGDVLVYGARAIAAYYTFGASEAVIQSYGVLSNDDEEARSNFFEKDYTARIEQGGILCGNDHYWYQCDEAHDGILYWIRADFPLEDGTTINRPVLLYECQEREEVGFVWVHQGTDLDGDGFLSTGRTDEGRDCIDFGPWDEEMDCPVLEDYQGKTREEINALLEDVCRYPTNSRCAVCINPAAPEVCGDFDSSGNNIDNDCNADTSNDCHSFQAGCEQISLHQARTGQIPGADIDEITGEPIPQEERNPQNNIYNQQFDWLDTDERGGYCCGFGGITDLGEKGTDESGEHICLNKNYIRNSDTIDFDSFIETAPAAESSPPTEGEEGGAAPSVPSGEWHWVAAVGTAAFNIMTIQKPVTEEGNNGQTSLQTYDLVSNNRNWYECTGEEGNLGMAGQAGTIENTATANRFYCYNEGNHYAFAECVPEASAESPNSFKTRKAGDGLFSFPMTGSGNAYEADLGQYREVYDRLDLPGRSFLEFPVRFTGRLITPANVKVAIKGPENAEREEIIYVEEMALGHAVNNPFLSKEENERTFIYIRMPLPDGPLLDVRRIQFFSEPSENTMEIQNVYITQGEGSLLCSGEESNTPDESPWLDDMDDGSGLITGENICKQRFGETTWLGEDIDVDISSANCCGNAANEYYAGKSIENVGCWNSVPIAPNKKTMNVVAEVGYKEVTTAINYPEQNYQVQYSLKNIIPFEDPRACRPTPTCEQLVNPMRESCEDDIESTCNGQIVEMGESCVTSFTLIPDEGQRLPIERVSACEREVTQSDAKMEVSSLVDIPADFIGTVYVYETETYYEVENIASNILEGTISLTNSPLIIEEIEVDTDRFTTIEIGPLEFPENQVDFYFANADSPGTDIGEQVHPSQLRPGTNKIFLMAKVNEAYMQQIEPLPVESTPHKTTTFTCTQQSCLFPLPGEPPYTITNPYPHLYNLYFVADENTKELIAGTSEFDPESGGGNLLAERVSQQVIYVNEGEESEEPPTFYGCEAASFIQNADGLAPDDFQNLNYCSIKAAEYCAPSKADAQGRDAFTTANSWDETGISKVGYERSREPETTLDFLDTFELRLRDTVADAQGHLPRFEPDERTSLTAVLPARNIISNPEFEGVTRIIPHWETSINTELRRRITDQTIILGAGEWLRTERIAIPQESTLHFSQADTCNNIQIFLVDKDGNTVGDAFNLQEIETDTAAFTIVEFRGPACRVRQPLLQIVDELGPATYEQATKRITDLEDHEARSGTACCPSGYCWNGYACVEPMGSYTYLAEHITDGRDYRCVDGEWDYLPVKFDWNQENWGFCEDVSQCFVQSNNREAERAHTSETFYQGQTPTCINDGDFILDNFCNEGVWSSRTKFIANKLLETAEDDFSLYCTDYREVLLNTNNPGDKEQYVGGQLAQEVTAQQTLAGTLLGAAETEIRRTCFDNLDASLVKTEDNTCINNACVFLNDGKVAVATSLNKPLSDPAGSFLFALNVPVDQLLETCPSGSGWQKCNIQALDIEGDLWYNAELNAIVYGKQGIQLEPGFFSRITQQILDFFSRFIGGEAEAEEDFAVEKQFKEIYLLEKGDKKVRAVQEITAREKILLAEYENFDTPVCDYVRKLSLPADAQTPLLEQVSGRERVSCSAEDTTQKVEISESLDFFWPQLTGRLRVG